MDDRGQARLEGKVDKIADKIGSIDVTLAAQNVTLAEHVRRTNLLEEELAPIKRKVAKAEGALSLMGKAALVIAVIEFILKVAGK